MTKNVRSRRKEPLFFCQSGFHKNVWNLSYSAFWQSVSEKYPIFVSNSTKSLINLQSNPGNCPHSHCFQISHFVKFISCSWFLKFLFLCYDFSDKWPSRLFSQFTEMKLKFFSARSADLLSNRWWKTVEKRNQITTKSEKKNQIQWFSSQITWLSNY